VELKEEVVLLQLGAAVQVLIDLERKVEQKGSKWAPPVVVRQSHGILWGMGGLLLVAPVMGVPMAKVAPPLVLIRLLELDVAAQG